MLTAGIDIGSISAKAALIEDGRIVGTTVMLTGYNARNAGKAVFAAMLDQAGLPRSLIDAGCYACHDVNGVRIGPPLRAVAGLYRTDPQAVDKLTHKIIHGGGGVWGPTPMIAHPQLDEAQARAMVEAILTLN